MIKLVLWDWNGTLLDDVRQSLECVNRLLRRRNMSEITLEQYYSYVDTPIEKFYEHLFDMSTVDFTEIAKAYHQDYDAQSDSLSLNDGATEVLEYFSAHGVKQTIVSAAHRDMIDNVIDKFGIKHYFDSILSSDDLNAGSKIDRARHYFAQANVLPDETLFIGDTLHDLETAESLGVKCILTTKGHQSIKQFPVDVQVVNNLNEIIPLSIGTTAI